MTHWRRQFRGEAQLLDDTAVTERTSPAITWALGDPGSNRVLARIQDRLPIRWTVMQSSPAPEISIGHASGCC